MNSVYKSIDQFLQSMIDSKKMLENFSGRISAKDQVIAQCVQALTHDIEGVKQSRSVSGDNNVSGLIENSWNLFMNMISTAENSINQAKKDMNFIEDFEKNFIVMVYGKVKCGKSYLGNYIMGQPIKKLGAETLYNSMPSPKVEVRDRNKKFTQDSLAEIGEFEVKSTEATSTIQYFYLGGLAWFDTPGIGSITPENERLAKEYAKNADLLVFLTNSDASGRQQEFAEIEELKRMGKPLLIIISQSDTYEEDVDENDEIVRKLAPKTQVDRSDVERYWVDELGKQNLSVRLEDIITISTKLALEGIKNGDAQMYRDSNVDEFYKKLMGLATPNTIDEYKMKNPRARINKLIDDINALLSGLDAQFYEMLDKTRADKKQIYSLIPKILNRVKAEAESKISNIILRLRTKVETGGTSVEESEINQQVNDAIQVIFNRVAAEEMSDFLTDAFTKNYEIALNVQSGELKMLQGSIPYQYTEIHRYERRPKGVFEHIGSFFGKTYYEKPTSSTYTKYSTYDIGINDQQILHGIMGQFSSDIEPALKDSIDEIVNNYFKAQEDILVDIIKYVKQTMKRLNGEKF